jgi:uncharacterized membrane protein YgcG
VYIWGVAALMTLQTVGANGVPVLPPGRSYVVDEAGVLDSVGMHTVDSIAKARAGHGMPVYVLTIRSVAAHDSTDATFEAYSRRVFDAWRTGRPGADRAALLIVSVEDRRARIETGPGWGREHDGAVQHIMDDAIEPSFVRGSLGQGIVAATYEITWALKPRDAADWTQDALMAASVVLAGLLALTLIRRYRASRPAAAAPAPRPAAAIDPKLRASQRMQAITEARKHSEKAASSIAWLDTGEMPKLEDGVPDGDTPTDDDER